MMELITLIMAAYFLGAVPFGLLIAKAHGKDLRCIGSGNIGATNVVRALGRSWGILCFILDMLKGLIPMLAVPVLGLVGPQPKAYELTLWLLVGCAAVLGHIFPVYLKFKGGKGVATSLGIVLGLWPYYTFCGIAAFAVWIVCVLLWRYVSLASILAAVSFPIFLTIATSLFKDWGLATLWPLLAGAVLMSLLVVFRHRANIRRLLSGTESKIFQSKQI
ncbi:MAG: glycerol-3-phosphate 1-O-acyltransferase PlsY [Phycisphaerae bacterium]|nr:glycerol-3-phosphate 1-O-acyltransferase PlsY [Phycisphaerae bacterium]